VKNGRTVMLVEKQKSEYKENKYA